MFRAIVVGTDGSETAKKAVREAGEIAKTFGARVHVVSAYEPLSGVKVGGEGGTEEPGAVTPTFAVDSVLEDAVGMLRTTGVEVERYARKGDAAESILEVTEEQKADLVVVGNRGMRGARRFLLGSVPDKISHHAPCSVMIVRTT